MRSNRAGRTDTRSTAESPRSSAADIHDPDQAAAAVDTTVDRHGRIDVGDQRRRVARRRRRRDRVAEVQRVDRPTQPARPAARHAAAQPPHAAGRRRRHHQHRVGVGHPPVARNGGLRGREGRAVEPDVDARGGVGAEGASGRHRRWTHPHRAGASALRRRRGDPSCRGDGPGGPDGHAREMSPRPVVGCRRRCRRMSAAPPSGFTAAGSGPRSSEPSRADHTWAPTRRPSGSRRGAPAFLGAVEG